MSGNANGKLRILYVYQMLQEQTDDQDGLTMTQIIGKLADLGVSVDRKTIYTDFETLREFGVVIDTYQRYPVEYAIKNREFSLDELMLLVDAVQSCRFITQHQCDKLSRSLQMLASDGQREKLARRIHVDGRVKGKGDHTFKNVDAIHEAMRLRRKVGFTYWKIDAAGDLEVQHDGNQIKVTPIRISYGDSFYYLTAWNDEVDDMREYRIDRMRDVKPLEDKATRKSEISNYEFQVRDSQFFGHFDGELVKTTLIVAKGKSEIIRDRFGKDAEISANEDGTSTARVYVRVSPQFFGWIAGMNGMVKIVAPSKLESEYVHYLQALISSVGQKA